METLIGFGVYILGGIITSSVYLYQNWNERWREGTQISAAMSGVFWVIVVPLCLLAVIAHFFFYLLPRFIVLKLKGDK